MLLCQLNKIEVFCADGKGLYMVSWFNMPQYYTLAKNFWSGMSWFQQSFDQISPDWNSHSDITSANPRRICGSSCILWLTIKYSASSYKGRRHQTFAGNPVICSSISVFPCTKRKIFRWYLLGASPRRSPGPEKGQSPPLAEDFAFSGH